MKIHTLSAAIICAVLGLTGSASFANASALAVGCPHIGKSAADMKSTGVILVDKHSYRHCHNIFHRTYCHKADRLPVNWPPHTDTPHKGPEDIKKSTKWW